MPKWWNGRRAALKTQWATVSVRVRPWAPFYVHCAITKFYQSREQIKMKVGIIMNIEILNIENRINLLRHRDPVGNAAIIKKLERRLRALRAL